MPHSQLSAKSFKSTPMFHTVALNGAAEMYGTLLFSPDERLLIAVGDSGHLQVWDIDTQARVLFYDDKFVRGILFDSRLGGLLAVADSSLLLFRATRRGFVPQVLVSELPGLSGRFLPDSDDASVMICRTGTDIMCCNRGHIVNLDSHTWRPNAVSSLPETKPDVLHHLAFIHRHQSVYVQKITLTWHGGTSRYCYSHISINGEVVFEFAVEAPGLRLLSTPDKRNRPGIITSQSGVAVVIGSSSDGTIDAYSIDPSSPCTEFISSDGGTVIGAVFPDSVELWSRRKCLGRYHVENSPFDVRLDDSGRSAVILFCDGLDSPDVTGVFDPATGEKLGHCTGHVVGLAPSALSPSRRHFATLVTEGTSSYHPRKLSSGTVMLSYLGITERDGK